MTYEPVAVRQEGDVFVLLVGTLRAALLTREQAMQLHESLGLVLHSISGRVCGAVNGPSTCKLHEGHVVYSDHESRDGVHWPVRLAYEPPAIESTAQLSPVASAIWAAQLTPEQIEERRRIGERRAPLRDAALKRFMHRAAAEATRARENLCAVCEHSEREHGHRECNAEQPSGEFCECDGFEQRHTADCARDHSCTCDGRSALPPAHG